MDELVFEQIIDKVILIGLTYYTADGVLVERKQYWGTVVESNEKGIAVRLNNGEILSLPPNLSSTKKAPPGEYRLRTTGELIANPDYLSTWNIYREK